MAKTQPQRELQLHFQRGLPGIFSSQLGLHLFLHFRIGATMTTTLRSNSGQCLQATPTPIAQTIPIVQKLLYIYLFLQAESYMAIQDEFIFKIRSL